MGKGVKRPAQLPKQQLLILAACRLAEPVASTSVYPYIVSRIRYIFAASLTDNI
jgi:hypothetical protein